MKYAERDTVELGEYYDLHINAMTYECLNSKSAIAAELAYRDKRIKELQAENTVLTTALNLRNRQLENESRNLELAEDRATVARQNHERMVEEGGEGN